MSETKCGMTRERWEEIRVVGMRGLFFDSGKPDMKDYTKKADALLELVRWIDGAATLGQGFVLEFDPPAEAPVVIDGPGEYVVTETNLRIGDIVPGTLVKITHREDGKWKGKYQVGRCDTGDSFSDAGEARFGSTFCRIAKHVPEKPALQEPIGEGEWWTDLDLGGKTGRLKVDVVRVPCHDGFAAAWTSPSPFYPDGKERHVSPIEPDGRFGADRDIQLVRRVTPPKVEPYTLDAGKGAMFGKTVRRKRDGNQHRVDRISDGEVCLRLSTSSQDALSWTALARDYEQLDGSPCGVSVCDPWDALTS